MFGSRKRTLDEHEEKQARERYERCLEAGMELNKRMVALHKVDRSRLQGDLRVLHADAKHETAMIRQSIADRTGYTFEGGGPDGDLFTFLAELNVAMVRENSADPQTVMQALADKLPDVRFTVHWYDAVSLGAAMYREQRVVNVIEGLELAGLWKGDRQ